MIQQMRIDDFSGGLNSISYIENMKENEFVNLTNMDISDSGKSIYRRTGFVRDIEPPVTGKGQGFFRYYDIDGGFRDIVAVGGVFYLDGVAQPIENLPGGFQRTLPIGAVQYQDKMYFATGTKFCEYDGTTFRVVEPYKPEPFDALYIGTNALAEDPDSFMTDGVSALGFRIDGVVFSTRYGYINEPLTLTAYSSYPDGKSAEYQFEWRHIYMEEGKWVLGQDWSSEKSWTLTPDMDADLQFRVNIREAGNTVAENQYLVPKLVVKPSKGEEDKNVELLHSCRHILLHWERIYLYGDPNNPYTLFFSELKNPNYFPMPNNIDFPTTEMERITKVKRYRDMLVVFTPNTIQTLYGKGPNDFERKVINSDIGCIAPESVEVVDNNLFFLSNLGVYYLKSVGTTEDRANVEPIDEKVKNHIGRDTDALAVYHNNQYQILFPSTKKKMKFHKTDRLRCWSKDESERFTFDRFYRYDNELYAQDRENGVVYRFDLNTFTDDGTPYTDSLETPYFNMGNEYINKKLKMFEILLSPKFGKINLSAFVYCDSRQVNSPTKEEAFINDQGEVEWQLTFIPNIQSESGTIFGEWILGESKFGSVEYSIEALRLSGRFKRSKIRIEHTEAKPNVILGFSYKYTQSVSDRS